MVHECRALQYKKSSLTSISYQPFIHSSHITGILLVYSCKKTMKYLHFPTHNSVSNSLNKSSACVHINYILSMSKDMYNIRQSCIKKTLYIVCTFTYNLIPLNKYTFHVVFVYILESIPSISICDSFYIPSFPWNIHQFLVSVALKMYKVILDDKTKLSEEFNIPAYEASFSHSRILKSSSFSLSEVLERFMSENIAGNV